MALAQKLHILIEDKALRNRIGKATRQKAEQEFSIENVIKRHLDIYNSIWNNE